MKTIIRVSVSCALTLGLLGLLFGCVSDQPKPTAATPIPTSIPAPAEEKYFTHTVKWSKESVSIIAGWYTGDIQNYTEILDANPEIDPKRIQIGTQVRIPERIMTTNDAMTKEYVDGFYSRGKAGGKKSKGPAKDNPVDLIPPKGIQ